MLRFKRFFLQLNETRAARAARFAASHGYNVEISGSLLKIFNQRSSATLLFRADHIVLEQIGVDLSERSRHHGSVMLDLIIAIADEAELRLELIAESPLHPNKADLSQNDLQAWYRRHHFVDADDVLMSRHPAATLHNSR